MRSEPQTGSPGIIASTTVKTVLVAAALSAVLTVGTGGVANPREIGTRGTNFEAPNDWAMRHLGLTEYGQAHAIAASDSLTVIRSNFEFTIVDLAMVLHVSRQTLYDWFADRQMPQPANIARMRLLESLSTYWRGMIGANISTVRHKFTDKPMLIEILSSDDLLLDQARAELRPLAAMRARVTQSQSISDLMREHDFLPASKRRQDEALQDAGW